MKNLGSYISANQALTIAFVIMLFEVPSSVAATYQYDHLGRIQTVQYENGMRIVYAYDAAGNRVTVLTSNSGASGNPNAVQDNVILYENQSSISFNPLANDSDPDGDPLTLYNISNGIFGTVTQTNGSPTVQYASSHKRTATERLYYVVTDPSGLSSSGEIAIALTNLSPVPVVDSISVTRNSTITFDPRTNDSDPGGDSFRISSIGSPAHGTASVAADGSAITYTPTYTYFGPDTFTYVVTDVDNGVATGTVNMTVRYGTNAPIAVNDTTTANTATARTIDPRTNDSDPDGSPLTIVSKTNGTHGTVVINGGVSVTYTSQSGWSGADSFTYTIADVDGQTATGTVAVTVASANQPPVANQDWMSWYSVWNVGTAAFKPQMSLDPRWNDSDPENNGLTVIGKTNGAYGTVTLVNNVLTWTKNTNVTGPATLTDSFTYTLSDGNGGTATGTVSVDVTVELYDPNP